MEAPAAVATGGRARLHRLHGRGQDVGRARRRRRRSARARSTPTTLLEERLGTSIEDVLRRARRGARSARPRRSSCASCSSAPPAPGALARRRRRRLRARARRARAPHRRAARRRRRHGVAARRRQAPAARARPRAASTALHAERARALRGGSPTPCSPTPRARPCGAPCPRCARCARRPRARSCCGRARPRATTRCYVGEGLLGGGLRPRGRAGAFLVTDEHGRRAATPTALGASPPTSAIPPGEEHKTLASRRARAARRWPRAGMDARRPRARARRRRRRRRRRASAPPSTSAACRVVQVPTTLVAAGRLRLRRQDRRRPARGQELRRRLPPAGAPCSPTRRRWPRCRRPSSPPAGPR